MSATSTGPRPTGRDSVGTVEDLHASATRMTGLTDFGDREYLDGLEVLLASYAQEAGLTPEGNKAHRALLRGALVAVVAVGLVATVFGWLSPLRTIDAHGPAVVASGAGGPARGPTT